MSGEERSSRGERGASNKKVSLEVSSNGTRGKVSFNSE